MSNECIKIPIWKYHCLIIVCEFTRKCYKAVTVTDYVFTHVKLGIKLYTVNLDSRDISYKSKTHIIVMEVVSQHLDQHKNNGLISKLHEILSGHIWVRCLICFLVNHGFMLWLGNWYGIYYTSKGVAL